MTTSSLVLTNSYSTTSSNTLDELKKQQALRNAQTGTAQNAERPASVPMVSNSITAKEIGFDRAGININKLASEYKKKASAIFDKVGLNFSDEQKAALKEYVTDEKSLKEFLKFVQQENLSEADIVAAMKEFNPIKEKQAKGLWGLIKRGGKTIGKFFTEGPAEAIAYAKSESVYLAEKMSKNVSESREERKDFSSETVAKIGRIETEHEELKADITHFTNKTNQDGSHLYSEEATMTAVEYMEANGIEKADEFTNNAVELESVTTPEGQIKFKGETIVNVAIKETEKSEIKEVTRAVAEKSDVNDETLVHVTDNLYENPEMADAIKYEATAKTEDGKDRFSAENISNTSDHLVDKDKETCQAYTTDMIKMAESNKNLTGSQIVELNHLALQNPEHRDAIVTRACDTAYAGKDIVADCKSYVAEVKANPSLASTSSTSAPAKTVQTEASGNVSNPILNTSANDKNVTVDGKQYNRSTILKDLSNKFGSAKAEVILQKLETNPKFLQLLKQYGNKKELRDAIVSDPQIIQKLQNISVSITVTDLAQMISICRNSSNTKAMILLSEITTPQKAIVYLKAPGTADKILPVLENSTITKAQKIETINNITGR